MTFSMVWQGRAGRTFFGPFGGGGEARSASFAAGGACGARAFTVKRSPRA